MYQLIEQLLNTLYGSPMDESIIQILAVTLTLNLVGLFLRFMRIEGKTWTYATYVIITLVALVALGGAQWSFSVS